MALYEELEADQGSTFKYQLTLTNEDNTPYDLTNFTASGQIKRTYKSLSVAATFNITKNNQGYMLLELTDEQTAAVNPGRYVYDVYIEASDGQKYRVIEGIINFTPAVTG